MASNTGKCLLALCIGPLLADATPISSAGTGTSLVSRQHGPTNWLGDFNIPIAPSRSMPSLTWPMTFRVEPLQKGSDRSGRKPKSPSTTKRPVAVLPKFDAPRPTQVFELPNPAEKSVVKSSTTTTALLVAYERKDGESVSEIASMMIKGTLARGEPSAVLGWQTRPTPTDFVPFHHRPSTTLSSDTTKATTTNEKSLAA